MTCNSLPDYQLRISPRARRVRIKVSPLGEIEVVVPPNLDSSVVPDLLYRRREWLNRTLARISANHQALPDSQRLRPGHILLAALDEEWQVSYASAPQALKLQQTAPGCLQLSGELSAGTVDPAIANLLRRWLHQRAKQALPGWIKNVSDEVGLPFNKLTIRGQKTRWGSCSQQKNINLNRNLLFLNPLTVRYLFLHELCHTVHMNHSRHFWQLVEQHVPDFRHHEKVLNNATELLPLWVYA